MRTHRAASRAPPAAPAAGAFIELVITSGPLSVHVIPYGLTVTRVLFPDAGGVTRDLLLGFDDPTMYCNGSSHPYFGATIGRYANRIPGGTFSLDGVTYNTPINEPANDDTLHGGTVGFDRNTWTVVEARPDGLRMRLVSPDGDMGFPGALTVDAHLSVAGGAFRIRFDAVADADTVINLSFHGCA